MRIVIMIFCNPTSEISDATENIYSGGMYYEKIGNNKWVMRFVVCQSIRVFLKVSKDIIIFLCQS